MYTWIVIPEQQRFENNLGINEEEFNELWCNHTMKYYSVIREWSSYITLWNDMEWFLSMEQTIVYSMHSIICVHL